MEHACRFAIDLSQHAKVADIAAQIVGTAEDVVERQVVVCANPEYGLIMTLVLQFGVIGDTQVDVPGALLRPRVHLNAIQHVERIHGIGAK